MTSYKTFWNSNKKCCEYRIIKNGVFVMSVTSQSVAKKICRTIGER